MPDRSETAELTALLLGEQCFSRSLAPFLEHDSRVDRQVCIGELEQLLTRTDSELEPLLSRIGREFLPLWRERLCYLLAALHRAEDAPERSRELEEQAAQWETAYFFEVMREIMRPSRQTRPAMQADSFYAVAGLRAPLHSGNASDNLAAATINRDAEAPGGVAVNFNANVRSLSEQPSQVRRFDQFLLNELKARIGLDRLTIYEVRPNDGGVSGGPDEPPDYFYDLNSTSNDVNTQQFPPNVRLRIRGIDEPLLRMHAVFDGREHRREIPLDPGSAGPDFVRTFFCVPGKDITAAQVFAPQYRDTEGNEDPVYFLKALLCFSGIVRCDPYRADDTCLRPPQHGDHPVLQDLRDFAGSRGFRGLAFESFNTGPTGAGFSSSSAVALLGLHCLYAISGQNQFLHQPDIFWIACLFENWVGRRSGFQDAFGLKGGLNEVRLLPPNRRQLPELRIRDLGALTGVDALELSRRLAYVYTMPRPKDTGAFSRLNVRAAAFFLGEAKPCAAMLASIRMHDDIVTALQERNWKQLGTLLSEYRWLRTRIDPGTTNPKVELLFQELEEAGLIYGGCYAGAGGGGMIEVVLTDAGMELA